MTTLNMGANETKQFTLSDLCLSNYVFSKYILNRWENLNIS